MNFVDILLEVELVVLVLMGFMWYHFNKRVTATEHKLDKDKETQNKLNEILVKIEQIKKD